MSNLKKLHKIGIILFCLLILFLGNINPSFSKMQRPKEDFYLNPYEIIAHEEVTTAKGSWSVLANRDRAPIFKKIHDDFKKLNASENIKRRADFLEEFTVVQRSGKFIYVKSEKPHRGEGWMDMHHVILITTAMRNPNLGTYQKVFPKVRVDIPQAENLGENRLRLRNGPCNLTDNKKNPYPCRTVKGYEEDIRNSNIFLYVYGVQLKDNSNYFDSSSFKHAEFYLVGKAPSFDPVRPKDTIMGWLPREGAILWETRQALEEAPNRQHFDAHRFLNRPMLYHYFGLREREERERFIEQHKESGKIIVDTKDTAPQSGNLLKMIILSKEKPPGPGEDVISEHIGFSGAERNDDASLPEIPTGSEQDFFVQLQEGAKHLELFFLVDATKSMKPCLDAASVVANSLINSLKDSEINLEIRAAVYRDIIEKPQHYEYWDPNKKDRISLTSWLTDDPEFAFSKKDVTFKESVYTGIDEAVKSWKKDFKHPFSIRVLMVLGDAGDNGEGPGKGDIIKLLKSHLIIPMALQLEHDWTSDKPSAIKLEKIAKGKFIDDFNYILSEFHPDPSLSNVRSIHEREYHQILLDTIQSNVNPLKNFIKDLPKVRLGMESIKDMICRMAYGNTPDLHDKCRECSDSNRLLAFVKNNAPTGNDAGNFNGEQNIGLFLAYLDILKNHDKTSWDHVMKRPTSGFNEGYIALSEKGERLTRPILLLSGSELAKLQQEMEFLFFQRKGYCNQEDMDKFQASVMTSILGDILQVKDPENFSRDMVKNMFDLVIDKENSGLKDILEMMCNDRYKVQYSNFIESLEKPIRLIPDLRFQKPEYQNRQYRDVGGFPYYWVYPEELFPTLKMK